MLEKVLPAVVNISTRTRTKARRHPLLDDPFSGTSSRSRKVGIDRAKQSLGSGVVVDAGKGCILTNHHVIDGADEITVTLRDQRQFSAGVAGSDPEVDLALIRIRQKSGRAADCRLDFQVRVGFCGCHR